jgi:AraC-like DNA-binding protein
MPDPFVPFPNSVFPVDVACLAVHANAVTCVLAGRRGPVTVASADQCVSGDLLLVRPGIEHTVSCTDGGADVLFLDGLALPEHHSFAQALEGSLANIASDAVDRDSQAQQELRARVTHGSCACPAAIAEIVRDLAADPMERMTQVELGRRLNMERTRALRYFKATTGQTFRGYKQWAGLQFAARCMMRGDPVRAAAMDAGFSDTAHLSRTFRRLFGLTPSAAIAALTPR